MPDKVAPFEEERFEPDVASDRLVREALDVWPGGAEPAFVGNGTEAMLDNRTGCCSDEEAAAHWTLLQTMAIYNHPS